MRPAAIECLGQQDDLRAARRSLADSLFGAGEVAQDFAGLDEHLGESEAGRGTHFKTEKLEAEKWGLGHFRARSLCLEVCKFRPIFLPLIFLS